MSALMLAFGIYIIGIAIVLLFRPSLMFNETTWKEFGMSSSGQYTLFPFWMFALLWAVFSYALATLGTVMFASLALRSEAKNFVKPVSSLGAPGYYIVEPRADAAPPRYVYFGSQPPTMENLRADAR